MSNQDFGVDVHMGKKERRRQTEDLNEGQEVEIAVSPWSEEILVSWVARDFLWCCSFIPSCSGCRVPPKRSSGESGCCGLH